MSVLEELKIVDVSVPTPITVRCERFDVFTPVHLDVGHARFSEPAREQAALAETCLAVGCAVFVRFASQVEGQARDR